MTPVERLVERLANVTKTANGYEARCPVHDDNVASLSVGEGDGQRALVHCKAGCETSAVVAALGLAMRDLFPRRNGGNGLGKIVATYKYTHENGEPHSEVVRFEPKDFRQRTPDGKWGRNGVEVVPYRLPELIEAKKTDRWIFWCEGEKDANRLSELGLVATTTPQGASDKKSVRKCRAYFRDANVVLLYDADVAGLKFMGYRAKQLAGIAKETRVVGLGFAPTEKHGKDISDWLTEGHTKEELQELVRQAPALEIDAAEPDSCDVAQADAEPDELGVSEDELPPIDAGEQDLAIASRAAWDAIHTANARDTRIFRYGTVPSRIELDDVGAPIIRTLTDARMRHELAAVAKWERRTRDGAVIPAMPPMSIVRDLLATPNPELPILTRVVEAPVFAADGSITTEPGYCASSRAFYHPAHPVEIPDVADEPDDDEVSKARALILDELLADFPFIGDAERAHAAALMLLPFAREMIDGPTPFHLVEKPSPGTGASLLVDGLLYPALGRSLPAMSEGRDEDEWRKRITAKLMEGPTAVSIDNLRRRLDCAALSVAITATTWEDRVLKASEIARVPVRCVWVGTGNNPALSNEMTRRTVRIRLDAKVERPWLREGFRHPDLRDWVAHHRGELVWAALTLIRGWIARGRPQGNNTIGMFESWSHTIGGILDVAGIPGFLGNLEDFYESGDDEMAQLRNLVDAWLQKHDDAEVTAKELFDLIEADDVEIDLGRGNEKSRQTILGKLLTKNRDRQFGTHRITRLPKVKGRRRWRLTPSGSEVGR